MDQTRQDVNTNGNNSQQNVHLHMHHVCACQNIYPTPYYSPINYRTPLIPYATPQTIPRPYLQHYQYTQFNVNGQFGLPITQLSSSTFGTTNPTVNHTPPESASVILPSTARQDRGDSQEGDNDFGPAVNVSDLFLMNNSEDSAMNTEMFIKFLERSCLTAEQIAYRNRNRPCFRNIQNLCIRTRSEILKPRTTVSNIHSQGIPWATKDFIYAFVRLTNCWHILKGYWENREGSALGKIEKELTPAFKACYVRWEKETVELAMELTRIFYNLDLNQSNPSSSTVPTNLIPPQVNLLKTPLEKATTTVTTTVTTTTTTTSPTTSISKNFIRGILHIPPETVDQGNQTGEFEDDDTNYMKPGSYHVPKKYQDSLTNTSNTITNNNPREIEFLQTAQNVSKNLDAVHDKYWVTQQTELYNVHEWLSTSNFSEHNGSNSNSPPPNEKNNNNTNNNNNKCLFTRDFLDGLEANNQEKNLIQKTKGFNGFEQPSRTYRRKFEDLALLEMKSGGLTKRAKTILEKIIIDLKNTELVGILAEGFMDCTSLELIQKNLIRDIYCYVNEVVRDLRHVVNRANQHFKKCGYSDDQIKVFSSKLESLLVENLPNCDFTGINGDRDELVGKLKIKNSFDNNNTIDGEIMKN